jgi:hypothetical protein
MITINQVKIEIVFNNEGRRLSLSDLIDKDEVLVKAAARLLRIGNGDIKKVSILKHSIDARKKPILYNVYTLGVELKGGFSEGNIVKKCRNNNIAIADNIFGNHGYIFPKQGEEKLDNPPVIIGMGPAGLFCGYMLAKHGYKPIILERGYDVETRTKDVEEYWNGGVLNPESNVQFGEGGAGTFSDGKLNTLVKDKNGRNKEVLRIFTEFGAPKHILYESKPHIGTDILKDVVANMRKYIIGQGGQVRFGAKVTGFEVSGDGCLVGVYVNDSELVRASQAVLAIGHSARDTFEVLDKMNISMEAKAFAVGMRVEHPQSVINEAMYGKENGDKLPAAPYKLTAQTQNGRGVYSFCMCPGGYVVNASSEEGRIAVNGMSYSDRGSDNANSAIIVQVTPEDFGGEGALAGVYFQRRLEEKAYKLGNGKIPVQYFGDYVDNASSRGRQSDGIEGNYQWINPWTIPCIKGGYEFTNLRGLLPDECEKSFIEAFGKFDKTIKGFADRGTVLSGIESRTSSPVRINRGEDLQSPSVKGLYPCGEGAGYAGGITSAAMDGIVVAERIAGRFTAG